MLAHYGNMHSRSFIGAIFGIRPRADTFYNIDAFIADCIDAFQIVHETMDKPDWLPDGNYSAQRCHTNYLKIHINVLDQFYMAYMVHLLPPVLQWEVMKKKPTTMAQSSEYALETQRILRDKNRPLGSQANPKP